ncbi:branched-chain amino acid ABC transporter permease [Thermodesulfobacteriota bacterium]
MGVDIHKNKAVLIPAIVVIVILIIFPLINVPQAWILYLFLFFIYLAFANMWNLLAGYCGLISLCQPAFIGLGGYTLAIFTWLSLPLYTGIIAGALVAALFAVIISLPVFRLSGIYFAIGTIVLPEVLRILFLMWRPVGGALYGKGAGYPVKGATSVGASETYWLALVVGIGSVIVMRYILRSNMGLALATIRDNENTAASSGINVFKLKLHSLVISALITGFAGAVFYISQGFIEPTSAFSVKWTMTLMLATVIGGISIENGPIVGSIVVVILHFMLARYSGLSMLIQGIILVIIMLVAPNGLLGALRKIPASWNLLKILHISPKS